jgi:hypothetical protein
MGPKMKITEYYISAKRFLSPNGRSNDDGMALAEALNNHVRDPQSRAEVELVFTTVEPDIAKALGMSIAENTFDTDE